MTVLTGGFKLGDSSATFDNYESINALSYNIYIQMEKIKKKKRWRDGSDFNYLRFPWLRSAVLNYQSSPLLWLLNFAVLKATLNDLWLPHTLPAPPHTHTPTTTPPHSQKRKQGGSLKSGEPKRKSLEIRIGSIRLLLSLCLWSSFC